jgi:hypothetical protein
MDARHHHTNKNIYAVLSTTNNINTLHVSFFFEKGGKESRGTGDGRLRRADGQEGLGDER